MRDGTARNGGRSTRTGDGANATSTQWGRTLGVWKMFEAKRGTVNQEENVETKESREAREKFGA